METNMFKTIVRIIIAALVALCLSMISGCCTTAGFLAGAIIDNSSSGQKEIPAWQIGTLQTNDYPTIITKSGDRIQGFYQSLYPISQSEYKAAYSAFRNTNSTTALFPSLGDTIDIIQSNHKYQGEIFQGFGYRYQKRYAQKDKVRIGSQCYYIITQSDSIASIAKYNVEDLKYIHTAHNDTIAGNILRNLLLNSSIPISEKILLTSPGKSWTIRPDQIEKATLTRKTKGRWLGAGIGLGLDIALLIGYMSISEGGLIGD
jgi:hypothetical protein